MMKPRNLEFFAIDFRATTATDKQQLPVPKPAAYAPNLYTAAFFCRVEDKWFIYRVIFNLPRNVRAKDLPLVFRNLEQGAYFTLAAHKRTKDPFKYFKDINLFRS